MAIIYFLHKIQLKGCHSEALAEESQNLKGYFAIAQYDENSDNFV